MTYNPKHRELIVEIVIEELKVVLASQVLMEGRGVDLFSGTISEDNKTWEAEWLTFPEYYGPSPERKRLLPEATAENAFVAALTFVKDEE